MQPILYSHISRYYQYQRSLQKKTCSHIYFLRTTYMISVTIFNIYVVRYIYYICGTGTINHHSKTYNSLRMINIIT